MPDNHTELAKQSYCIVKKTSPMLEEVRYYDQELFSLSECRQVVLNDTGTLAKSLAENEILRSISGIAETKTTSIINELGDIRRFQSTNQINVFYFVTLSPFRSEGAKQINHPLLICPLSSRQVKYLKKCLFLKVSLT